MARAAPSDNPSPEPYEGVTASVGRKHPVLRQNFGSALVLVAGVALAALLFISVGRYFSYAQTQRVDLPAQNIAVQVTEVLTGYSDELQALAALYSSSPFITRRDFSSFIQRLSLLYPHAYSLTWAPRVTAQGREAFMARARADGFPDFEITARGPDDTLQPAPFRDVYFPTYYIEPMAGNDQAIGFDQLSEPVRAAALNAALDGQLLAVTGRVRLLAGFYGVIGYLPVRTSTAGFGEEADDQRINGVVAGLLNVGSVIDTVMREFRTTVPLDVYLYDLDGTPGERLLHFRPAVERTTTIAPLREDLNQDDAVVVPISIGGRTWALAMRPIAPVLNRYETLGPYGAALTAMLLAALLASIVAASGSRAFEVERKVRDRTRELRESEDQIRLLANSLPAMIMYVDASRRFRFVNQATEKWLASDRNLLIGKAMEEALGADLYKFQRQPMDAALRGDSVSTSAQVTYPDGKAREVETIYVPHQSPNGRVLGVYALAIDVSDRRRLCTSSELLRQVGSGFSGEVASSWVDI